MDMKRCDLCKTIYSPSECGKEYDSNGVKRKDSKSKITLHQNYSIINDNGSFSGNYSAAPQHIDLCPECADSLREWMDNREQEQKR